MIFLLLVVTASFHPPAPTVGDRITVRFPSPVILDLSDEYEVVERDAAGTTFVLRTFEPRPFTLSGTSGSVRFRNLEVPVRSVLHPLDSLEPAPLRPPLAQPPSSTPWIATGIAGGLALLAWAAVLLLARRLRPPAVEPALPPVDRFRLAVEQLCATPGPGRWADLADALRRYIAARDPILGEERTTSEILRALAPRPELLPIVADVLRQGDLEKFSPWGAVPADFDALASRALTLTDVFDPPPPPPAEEEEAAA